jgi:Mitochondrial carrier protein
MLHGFHYVGGAGSTSLSHPLDSVKVKLQTFPELYRGGLDCIIKVTREEGIRGLYRGLTPGVTLSMTEASIRYATYGLCQVRKISIVYQLINNYCITACIVSPVLFIQWHSQGRQPGRLLPHYIGWLANKFDCAFSCNKYKLK